MGDWFWPWSPKHSRNLARRHIKSPFISIHLSRWNPPFYEVPQLMVESVDDGDISPVDGYTKAKIHVRRFPSLPWFAQPSTAAQFWDSSSSLSCRQGWPATSQSSSWKAETSTTRRAGRQGHMVMPSGLGLAGGLMSDKLITNWQDTSKKIKGKLKCVSNCMFLVFDGSVSDDLHRKLACLLWERGHASRLH